MSPGLLNFNFINDQTVVIGVADIECRDIIYVKGGTAADWDDVIAPVN